MARGYGLNKTAAVLLQRMAADAAALGVEAITLVHGATVIDAGIRVPGSLAAGALFAEASLGGLGRVSFAPTQVIPDLPLPGAFVEVSRPAVACLGAQYAGWNIRMGQFAGMGSGPARALARVEQLFAVLDVEEQAEVAVLMIEGRALPDEATSAAIAERCGVSPAGLTITVAPTASIVGAVQVAARSVEAVLHKMLLLHFPVASVTDACGISPIAPVARDDGQALGWVNDCLLYGARAWLTVDASDDEVSRVVPLLPSGASPESGRPFADILSRAGNFYRIDPLAFGVAEVVVTSRRSGKVYRAGAVNPGVLRASLLGEDE